MLFNTKAILPFLFLGGKGLVHGNDGGWTSGDEGLDSVVLPGEPEGDHMEDANDQTPVNTDDMENGSDIDACLLLNEFVLHNKNDKPMGTIPVQEWLYSAGIFVEPARSTMQVYNETCSFLGMCNEIGTPTVSEDFLYCKLCTFKKNVDWDKLPDILQEPAKLALQPCSKEVKKIAVSCPNGKCVPKMPSIDEYLAVHEVIDEASAIDEEEFQLEDDEENERRNLRSSSESRQGRKLQKVQRDSTGLTDRRQWMYQLRQRGLLTYATLSDLVLPGSHDSAAIGDFESTGCNSQAKDWGKFMTVNARRRAAKTQSVSIQEQLNAGIRYLDIRFAPDNGLKLHHGFYINTSGMKTVRDALQAVNSFLSANPFETVVVAVRTNGCGSPTQADRNSITQLINSFSKLEKFSAAHMDTYVWNLGGKGLIDVQSYMVKGHYPGDKFGHNNPHDLAKYHTEEKGTASRFNVAQFIPIPNLSDDQWVWETIFCITCDGLEDWNHVYEEDKELIHSALGQDLMSNNVNAISFDRAHNRIFYDVATRLTLARLYNKAGGKWNAIVPLDWLNSWDKRFEGHCPEGYVLQGLKSKHDNGREDRLWKTQCGRVDWIEPSQQSFTRPEPWYNHPPSSDGLWESCSGSECHSWYTFCGNAGKASGEACGPSGPDESYWKWQLDGAYDEPIYFGFPNGEYAITGFGGVHRNKKEDRRYWFYRAKVKSPRYPAVCSWTPFVNEMDGPMDWAIDETKYIAGVISIHDNHKEDRKWRFYVCSK